MTLRLCAQLQRRKHAQVHRLTPTQRHSATCTHLLTPTFLIASFFRPSLNLCRPPLQCCKIEFNPNPPPPRAPLANKAFNNGSPGNPSIPARVCWPIQSPSKMCSTARSRFEGFELRVVVKLLNKLQIHACPTPTAASRGVPCAMRRRRQVPSQPGLRLCVFSVSQDLRFGDRIESCSSCKLKGADPV